LLGGVGVDAVQITAEAYRVDGGAFGDRVEGNERPVERRQAEREQRRETGQ
jgi:hypothetical protein